MFHLFGKKEKSPIPLFEALGTDMHCHLLPQVDDGSKSFNESVECLRTMKKVGYSHVTLTPHFCFPRFPNHEVDIQSRFAQFKEQLAQQAPDVLPMIQGIGGEYRVDDGFQQRFEEGVKPLLTANGKYLLLELSLHQQRLGLEQTSFDLQMKGYDLVLAHPERYPYYGPHSETLKALKDQGVLFQSNLLSFSGFYGEAAQRRAFEYVEQGWIELLGTDLHNTLYAHALEDATNNRRVRKLIETTQFMNSEI